MERITMPKFGQGKMKFHSSYCEDHIKPVQRMIINDVVVCPRCETERENQKVEAEMQEYYRKLKTDEKFNTLFNKSVLEDRTLLDARLENYKTTEREETENKETVLQCIERYKNGEVFNLILQGKQGTGKSHLGYSVLYELNQSRDHSCLFVSVDAMLRKIKNSFNDKDSKYTEEYFNKLLASVDFLVLDDIGAETGAIDTSKTATDFVQRVLYGMTNARQDKPTIITTNLDSKTLFSMYDKKLVSRLFKKPKYVIFKETKDKRTINIPF